MSRPRSARSAHSRPQYMWSRRSRAQPIAEVQHLPAGCGLIAECSSGQNAAGRRVQGAGVGARLPAPL